MSMKRRDFLAASLAGAGGALMATSAGRAAETAPHPGPGGRGRKVFVIGGPGNIGTSTLEVLTEKGCEVGLYTLPKSHSDEWAKKLKFFLGDRNDKAALKAAFDEFQPDYVVDFVLFNPEQAQAILDIMYGKVKQYVFVSTVDVVGFPLSRIPMKEHDPYVTPIGNYAQDKLRCEELFLSKHEPDKFPLTIARPTYSLGAYNLIGLVSTADSGRSMMQRLYHEKPVLVPGDGTTLMTVSHARNTGRVIARTIGDPIAVGKTYFAGQEEIICQDDYVRCAAKAVGREPKIVHVPTDLILAKGGQEARKTFLTFLTAYHLAFSIEAFRKDFPDFQYRETVEDGLRSFAQANEAEIKKPVVENFDDRVIAAWSECTKHFTL